jgi:hypothetical protein
VGAGTDNIQLVGFTADSACCQTVQRYRALGVASEAFRQNLQNLCGDADLEATRCRREFAFIVDTLPFVIRSNSSVTPKSLKAQCQSFQPPTLCNLTSTVNSGVSFDFDVDAAGTASGTSGEDCCALVRRYVAVEEVAAGSGETTVFANSVRLALCQNLPCYDAYALAALATGAASFPPHPPSMGTCADLEIDFADTCEVVTGDPSTALTGVSSACCLDGAEYFQTVFVLPSAPDATLPERPQVCSERACFEGYSAVLGADILDATCTDDDGSADDDARRRRRTTASHRAASTSTPMEVVPADPPRARALSSEGSNSTAGESNSCIYDEVCDPASGVCWPGQDKPDGTTCEWARSSFDADGTVTPTVTMGRCSQGVCASIPRCAKYDGGDVVCASLGLPIGTLVFVKPSPLSYFTLEGQGGGQGGIDAETYGLSTLHAQMQAHVALSHHGFYECQVPHLRYACSVVYPRCAVVDNESGDVVTFNEEAHAHLLSLSPASLYQAQTDAEAQFVALPLPTCRSTCEDRNTFCTKSDVFLQSALGNPPQTPACDGGRYGDDQHPKTDFEYFVHFEGQLVYPPKSQSLNVAVPLTGYTTEAQVLQRANATLQGDDDDNVAAIFCQPVLLTETPPSDSDAGTELVSVLRCPVPYLPHPNPGLDDPPCILPCLLPLYDDGDVRSMYLAYVITGVLGMVLCLVQLAVEVKQGRLQGRSGNRQRESIFILVYCSLGVLYGFLDTLPVAVMYTDLPCTNDTVLNKGNSLACHLNRISSAILLSLYYWMAAHTLYMYLKLVRSATFKRLFENTSTSQRKVCPVFWRLAGVCFGVPLLSMILVVALDTGYDPLSPLHYTHINRDMFTCSPRFDALWIEILCVHIHFVLCSGAIVWALFGVSRHIAFIVRQKRKNNGGEEKVPEWTIVQVWAACPRVFILALLTLCLLAIHTVLTIELVPQWGAYGAAAEDWIVCKRLQDACLEVEGSVGVVAECDGHRYCGQLTSDIPSVGLMQVYFFTQAALVLIVGVTFLSPARLGLGTFYNHARLKLVSFGKRCRSATSSRSDMEFEMSSGTTEKRISSVSMQENPVVVETGSAV